MSFVCKITDNRKTTGKKREDFWEKSEQVRVETKYIALEGDVLHMRWRGNSSIGA